jgi:DNA-binding NarL/FixJ family response regulator
MDKHATASKGPRQLIVIVAVEVPPDNEAVLRSDAAGCYPRLSRSEVLVSAIGLVLARRRYLLPLFLSPNSNVRGPVWARPGEGDDGQQPHVPQRLSPRHREVVGLIAQGLSNKMIARQLGLAEGTVRSHLVQIFQILGVHNRTAAVMVAQELFASGKAQDSRKGLSGARLNARSQPFIDRLR